MLEYLKGDHFEPLESANLTMPTQKALFLILLASGRRKREIANLSREFVRLDDSTLELDFQPAWPSISRLISNSDSDRFLCPVRAYMMYLEKSQVWWDRNPEDEQHEFLWTVPLPTFQASPEYFVNLIGGLVGDLRRFLGNLW